MCRTCNPIPTRNNHGRNTYGRNTMTAVRNVRWRPVLVFLAFDLALTAFFGGWVTQGRLDPLFALAPHIVSTLMLVFWLRHERRESRYIAYLVAMLAAALSALLFGALLGSRVAWGQALVAAAGGMAWAMLLDFLMHRQWPALGRAIAILVASFLALGAAWQAMPAVYSQPIATARPKLVVLSSLPLGWSGGDFGAILSGANRTSPAIAYLEQSFEVELVDSLNIKRLEPNSALLLAHPRAMSPEELVALDAWLRAGGNAVILADAFVAQEPPFAIGDPRNPPITSLLTPLLDHWGLELALPAYQKEANLDPVYDGALKLLTVAPGRFVERRKADGVDCVVALRGLQARCSVGQGHVMLFSDVDMVNDAVWRATPATAFASRNPLSAQFWRADNMLWLRCQLFARAQVPSDCAASLAAVWIK